MSMNLTVYVGPYLECNNLDDEIWYDHEHLVTDAIGEGYCPDGLTFLIANRPIPGIDRQLSFDSQDYPEPIELLDQINEQCRFLNFVESFMEVARKSGATVNIRWGIVCGIF